MLLSIHIFAGGLALVAGFIALYTTKGGTTHRRMGMLFVCAMLPMSISASILAVVHGIEPSIFGGLLTAYLIVTALTAVRPPTTLTRRVEVVSAVLAVPVGVALLAVGLNTLGSPGGRMDGIPAAPSFLFGAVALVGSASDFRMIRAGGLRGAPRIARHLWRMCLALFIAAGSFFLGQADELPKAIRIVPLLAVPALAPLAAMAFCLWRVRIRSSYRTLIASTGGTA